MRKDRSASSSRSLTLYAGPDEIKTRTWVQLARTFYKVQRRIVLALTQHDCTMPQFDVLATLRFSEGVTQQELAERLLVTKGNVCGVLDRLESLRWVERCPDPKDARANRLYLTTAGRRKIDSVLPDHDATVIRAMQDLAMPEVKDLRRLLEALETSNEVSNDAS